MVYTVVEISVFELRNIVITGGIHQIFFNASNILYFLINSRSAGQTGANKSQMRRQKSQQAHHSGAGPRPPSGLGEKNSKLVRDVSCIVSAGRRGAGRPAGPGGAAAVTAERPRPSGECGLAAG